MKTKHFCMLLLTVGLFAACEKSEKLSAPSGLQGQQLGNTIVLAWNRVDGAISYEVQRNGMYLATTSSTNYTDNNPSQGYNSYEVTASDGSSRSQAAYVNVFFDNTSSGGNGGGGSNPGGNTEQESVVLSTPVISNITSNEENTVIKSESLITSDKIL